MWRKNKMCFKKIMYLFIITLFLSSCVTVSTRNMGDISNSLPRNSFVHLNKALKVTSCNKKEECVSVTFRSAASGYIVSIIPDGSYVITAAHFCENKNRYAKAEISYRAKRLDGKDYSAMVLEYQRDIDVCLMFVDKLTEKAKPVKISNNKPIPGEKAYSIGAPMSIVAPDMVPIIEGIFNGDVDISAVYSLPAAPGSSGSMIVNSDGELVGMVHSVYLGFHHITLSTTYEDLVNFIQKKVHKYILYKSIIKKIKFTNPNTKVVPKQ